MSLEIPDCGEIELLDILLGDENGPLSPERKAAAKREYQRKAAHNLGLGVYRPPIEICEHNRLNDHGDACLDCGAVYTGGRWQ